MKRDIIDSLLIGYLSTYLPFWQFDNLIQQMLAAVVLAGWAWAVDDLIKEIWKKEVESCLKKW